MNRRRITINRTRRRLGITAVIGAVLMIGVTLAVGFAAWAWARSAAQNSENVYGNQVSSNINYLRENFAIVNENFSASGQTLTAWFYNPGNVTVYVKQMWISNVTGGVTKSYLNASDLSAVKSSPCGYCIKLTVGVTTLVLENFGTKYTTGSTYTITALGQYGNSNSYLVTR